MLALHFLRFLVRNIEFLGDLLSDRIAGDRNGADEKAFSVDEDQCGTVSADVQKHFALGIADSVRARRIVGRRRGHFDQRDALAEFLDRLDDFRDFLVFDDDEHGVDFVAGLFLGNRDHLGIPNDLVHREGNRLFGFIGDDLADLVLVRRHRRNLHEANEGAVAGNGNMHVLGGKIIDGEDLHQGLNHRFLRRLSVRRTVFAVGEALQNQAFAWNVGKLCGFDAVSADVDA